MENRIGLPDGYSVSTVLAMWCEMSEFTYELHASQSAERLRRVSHTL